MSRIVNVVAAIIQEDGRVFAARRAYGELAGGWEFPGGKIEPGETPEEALKREIREELDFEIEVGEPICTGVNQREYTTFRMQCFLCTIKEGRPKLSEHSDAKWVGRSDIEDLDWLPADECGVRALLEQELI